MLRNGLIIIGMAVLLAGAASALAADAALMRSFNAYDPVRLKGFDAVAPSPPEKFSKFKELPKPPEVKLAVPDQKYATFANLQTPKVTLPPYVEPPSRNYASMRPIAQGAYATLPKPVFKPYSKFSAFSK